MTKEKVFKELDEIRKLLTTSVQKKQLQKVSSFIDEYIDQEGLDDYEQPEYANTIEAGIGEIHWYSDNLQLIAIMEALKEKLKTCSPNSITDHINAI